MLYYEILFLSFIALVLLNREFVDTLLEAILGFCEMRIYSSHLRSSFQF